MRLKAGRNWRAKGLAPVLAVLLVMPFAAAFGQIHLPVEDSIHAISLRNEKAYRLLNAMDDKGSSYEFTNVTAWKITDDNLRNQIIDLYTAKYGKKELKNFDIDNVYIFSVPNGTDQAGDTKFFPFHVLFMGKHVNVDTNASESNLFFGGSARKNTNQSVPVAFKGQQVIPVMLHTPGLVDNINAIQGDMVELPGDILPRGVQLIKNADERYIFHEMFTGFYSKRTIIDQQDMVLGLPTSGEMMAPADTNAPQIPLEPDETQELPVESLNSQAFRYQKTIDISIDHLTANVSRADALEIQIGNPEVGLPFWSSGEARLWLTMHNQIGTESDFQIGVDMPNFGLGNINHAIFEPRQLSGGWGGSVAAYFAGLDFFSAFNMPLAFNFSFFPSGGSNSSIIYNGVGGPVPTPLPGGPANVPANRTFYRNAFIGQMYIPFIVQLDPASFVQFSAGVGVHMVRLSWIPATDSEAQVYGYGSGQGGTEQDLTYNGKANVSTPFTPHVAIDYVNHRANKFGLDFQYDHLFTFGGWLELIPDHLRVEASYTAPLVRAALPYEPPYFFEITPRLYF
ncbi:MAG: hypothetical protein ACHQNE_06495 [Candidatus Kapaibacterium sp.]